jgi:hypothetical protein
MSRPPTNRSSTTEYTDVLMSSSSDCTRAAASHASGTNA